MERDPLSVQFDRAAHLAVTLAIQQHEKHRGNSRLKSSIKVSVPNPARVIPDRTGPHAGKDSLSPHERGFLRACYYDDRIHQWTGRKKPDAVWSLKATWGPPSLLPGKTRSLTLEVFSDTSGARHVKDGYKKRQKYTENAEYVGRAEGLGS